MKQSSIEVLEQFRQEHVALRGRLAAACGEAGREEAADDSAWITPRDVDDLRERLMRHSRLESDLLRTAVSGTDAPTEDSPEAQARCDEARQLLERLDALSYVKDDATSRALFKFFCRSAVAYLDAGDAILMPQALEDGEMGQRVEESAEKHAEQMPAATRTEDGRLDIGTAEDRNPVL